VTREKGKNTAASIRARLLALAQNKREDYQRVLGRYAIERFLYRLGRSPYRDKFAVKGATLFTLWTGHTHRPTFHEGFSDIEFNPYRSINCQARSIALFLSLMKREELDDAIKSPASFLKRLQTSAYGRAEA
jgi:hypothetical protein